MSITKAMARYCGQPPSVDPRLLPQPLPPPSPVPPSTAATVRSPSTSGAPQKPTFVAYSCTELSASESSSSPNALPPVNPPQSDPLPEQPPLPSHRPLPQNQTGTLVVDPPLPHIPETLAASTPSPHIQETLNFIATVEPPLAVTTDASPLVEPPNLPSPLLPEPDSTPSSPSIEIQTTDKPSSLVDQSQSEHPSSPLIDSPQRESQSQSTKPTTAKRKLNLSSPKPKPQCHKIAPTSLVPPPKPKPTTTKPSSSKTTTAKPKPKPKPTPPT